MHGGRPRDEEPHVKRSMAKNKDGVEYIVRVDLVRMKWGGVHCQGAPGKDKDGKD